jgi:hypothetical protein
MHDMMMGHLEKFKGGDEYDVVSKWRKMICRYGKPGMAKAVKRQMNKCARKTAKLVALVG